MKLFTLIKNGIKLNYTLSSVRYNTYGKRVNNDILVCDTWREGISQVLDKDWTHLLLINSGTVFNDWEDWVTFVEKYPVKEFVGHLIWNNDENFPILNEQCTLVSREHVDIFLNDNLVNCPTPLRSNKNLHDDYTPLYIYGDKDNNTIQSGPLANALQKNIKIVNWNETARDKKFFLYHDSDVEKFINKNKDYIELIENQLWILNNEPVYILTGENVLTVGSGCFWIMNVIQENIKKLTICDISKVQIKFCEELWHNWNGLNYGNFVYDFIKNNNVIHYQLDNPNFSKLELLQFRKKDFFINYINSKFEKICGDLNVVDFEKQWHESKSKKISFNLGNIVKLSIEEFDNIWASNAKDFKWTMLHE